MTIMNSRLAHDERGVEIIEFAMMLPLLALLLAGAIEYGRAFYTYNILNKSVRNAVRYLSATEMKGAAIDNTNANYVTKAKTLAVYGNTAGTGSTVVPNLTAAQINVSVAPGGSAYYVTVGASYPYKSMFGNLLPNATFKPKVTMVFVGKVNP